MFERIIHQAEHSVETLVTGVMARIAVAVPLLVAFGFATAAATVWLTQIYGSLIAYLIVAGAFAALGLLAAVIAAPERPEAITEKIADVPPPEPIIETIVDGALNNHELLLALFGTAGPAVLPALMRGLGKNVPLVLAGVFVACLLYLGTLKSQIVPANAEPGTA